MTRRSGSRLWLLVAAIFGVVVVGAVAVVAVLDGSGEPSVDAVFGLPAVENDDVRALRDVMGEIQIGDLEVDVLGFGKGGSLEAVAFVYRNLPAGYSIDGMVRGAGGGVIGSGGSADLDAMSTHVVGGVEYVCVPISGQMVPSGPDTNGVGCGWDQGDGRAVMLMDTSTGDAETAAVHAAELHDSLAA